jgi:hypothetical protein
MTFRLTYFSLKFHKIGVNQTFFNKIFWVRDLDDIFASLGIQIPYIMSLGPRCHNRASLWTQILKILSLGSDNTFVQVEGPPMIFTLVQNTTASEIKSIHEINWSYFTVSYIFIFFRQIVLRNYCTDSLLMSPEVWGPWAKYIMRP